MADERSRGLQRLMTSGDLGNAGVRAAAALFNVGCRREQSYSTVGREQRAPVHARVRSVVSEAIVEWVLERYVRHPGAPADA